MPVRRFDHVGITVRDLDVATRFFALLGFEPEGPSAVIEGEFIDTVIGMTGARTEIVMLTVPGSDTKLELSAFRTLRDEREQETALANVPGLRSLCFEVDDLLGVVDRLVAAGHSLVGGIGEWEGTYRMAYIAGPDGILLALAERVG